MKLATYKRIITSDFENDDQPLIEQIAFPINDGFNRIYLQRLGVQTIEVHEEVEAEVRGHNNDPLHDLRVREHKRGADGDPAHQALQWGQVGRRGHEQGLIVQHRLRGDHLLLLRGHC